MKFVATKTADQLDLQALHRVRERLVSQRTVVVDQIRAFLRAGCGRPAGLTVLACSVAAHLSHAATCCRFAQGTGHQQFARPKTGAGSISGLITYRVRLPFWPDRTLDASG